jgi:hypothetical protein
VRVVERRECRRRGLLEADVEQEPAPACVEEVPERLGALAAGPGRPRGRAEREERALEVAPRRVVAGAGAQVAADRRLRTDLAVGDVERALRERGRRVGKLREAGHGGRRADDDRVAVRRDRVEPRSPEHQRPGG